MNSPLLNAICFLTPSSHTEYLLRRLYGFGLRRFGILHCYLKVQGVPAFTESAIDASVSSPDFDNLERPNVQPVKYMASSCANTTSRAPIIVNVLSSSLTGGVRDRERGRTALSAAMSESSALLPVVC